MEHWKYSVWHFWNVPCIYERLHMRKLEFHSLCVHGSWTLLHVINHWGCVLCIHSSLAFFVCVWSIIEGVLCFRCVFPSFIHRVDPLWSKQPHPLCHHLLYHPPHLTSLKPWEASAWITWNPAWRPAWHHSVAHLDSRKCWEQMR